MGNRNRPFSIAVFCVQLLLSFISLLMLMTLTNCQPHKQSDQTSAGAPATGTPADGTPADASSDRLVADRPCGQTTWQAHNSNRYTYEIDANRRLSRCIAYERDDYGINYVTTQTLAYNPAGQLDRVDEEEGQSRYHYQNSRLTRIEFMREGQPIYQYTVTLNAQGLIVGLRGTPLNDSGLGAFSVRYTLDAQGRYIQLETRTDQGELYYRVVQGDFEPRSRGLYDQFGGIPFDINQHPWISWIEQFPVSRHLPRRVDVFRFAAPETPTTLIKRASRRVSYRTDRFGYVTTCLNTNLIEDGRDTVRIEYRNCR